MYSGVCAHNGVKSGMESDSVEDRLWLMTQVLSRTGAVEWVSQEWTTLKELVLGKEFKVTPRTKATHMDYDMKRKPDRSSFSTQYPVIEGVKYEIANFSTVPFESIEEYRYYRRKKKDVDVLRTEKDWEKFFVKIDTGNCGAKVRDLAWAILNSCIMGHRSNRWCIPMLEKLTGQERNDWINSHNTSRKVFTGNDWKNAGKRERQTHILDRELLVEKLDELMSDV